MNELSILSALDARSGIALATVKAIADWIVVMRDGRIVQQGAKGQVLTPPHHPYTDLLLSSVPEMATGWLDNLMAERAARKAQQLLKSADQ